MSPSLPPGDPDRALELEAFLEVSLQALADEAVEAGWSDAEVDAALMGLVRARLLQRIAHAQAEAATLRSRRMAS
jgi:hypothetical protein